jgi:predicted phosphoadenosine phosphosulfate sulfurtransferase
VAASGRAPSWREVAVALLKNDIQLYSLGFSTPAWNRQRRVLAQAHLAIQGEYPDFYQLELFK